MPDSPTPGGGGVQWDRKAPSPAVAAALPRVGSLRKTHRPGLEEGEAQMVTLLFLLKRNASDGAELSKQTSDGTSGSRATVGDGNQAAKHSFATGTILT